MNSPHNPEDPSNDENSLPKYQDWPVTNSDTRPVRRGAIGSNPAIMAYPITTIRREPGNKAIAILRIFLWLMPAFFIPIAAFLIVYFHNAARFPNEEILLGITFILVIIATAAVGYFDQRLKLMQEKIAPPHNQKQIALWTFVFVLAQIFIAPSLCYTVLYGYCLATGTL